MATALFVLAIIFMVILMLGVLAGDGEVLMGALFVDGLLGFAIAICCVVNFFLS